MGKTTFDEVLSIGFDVQNIEDIVAKKINDIQKNSTIKIDIDTDNMIKEFLNAIKKFHELEDKFKLDNPMEWDASRVLDEMKKVSQELKNIDNQNLGFEEYNKAVDHLSAKLVTLHNRFEDLDGVMPRANAKGGAGIKLILSQLKEIDNEMANGKKFAKLDFSTMNESLANELNQQKELVKKMFSDIQDTLGFSFDSAFGLDTKEYEAKIELLKKKNEELEEQIDKLNAKQDELKHGLNNGSLKSDEYEKLSKAIEILAKRLGIAGDNAQKITDAINGLNGDNAVSVSSIFSGMEKIGQYIDGIKQFVDQIGEFNKRIQDSAPRDRYEQLEYEIRKTTDEIKKLEEESNSLRDSLLRIEVVKTVNNVKNANVGDIQGLLKRYNEDQEEYHLDKAAQLFAKLHASKGSNHVDRVLFEGKDYTPMLTARYEELFKIWKSTGEINKRLGDVNREIFPKRQYLEKLKSEYSEYKKSLIEVAETSEEQKKKNQELTQSLEDEKKKTGELTQSLEEQKKKLVDLEEFRKKFGEFQKQQEVSKQAREQAERELEVEKEKVETEKKLREETEARLAAAQQEKEQAEQELDAKKKQLDLQKQLNSEQGDGTPNTPKEPTGAGKKPHKLPVTQSGSDASDNSNKKTSKKLPESGGVTGTPVDGETVDIGVRLVVKDVKAEIANIQNQVDGETVDIGVKISESSIRELFNNIQRSLNNNNSTEEIIADQNRIQEETGESKEYFEALKNAITDYLNALKHLDEVSNHGIIPNLNQRRVVKDDAISAAEVYKNSGFVDNDAENVLVRYISRLKDVDKALQSFGITNDDVISKIKDKLKIAIDTQEQYVASSQDILKTQMQLSNVLKENYLVDTNKTEINSFLKTVDSNTSVEDFANKIKELFGVDIPISIERSEQAVKEFDQATSESTNSDNNKIEVDIIPKIDADKFIAEIQTPIDNLGDSGFINIPVKPNVKPSDFINEINKQLIILTGGGAANGTGLEPIDIPIKFSDNNANDDEDSASIIGTELGKLKELVDFINTDVINAIQGKTEKFKEEKTSVEQFVDEEVSSINKLIVSIGLIDTSLKTIIDYLDNVAGKTKNLNFNFPNAESLADFAKALGDVKTNGENLPNFSNLKDLNFRFPDPESIASLAKSISKLKKAGDGLPDFTPLAALNNSIKLNKGNVEKFTTFAVDIADGLKLLIDTFDNGNYTQSIESFLNQIQRLVDSSTQFKELISAINNLNKIDTSIGKDAIDNFNNATNDYINAYLKNDGSAQATVRLEQANKNLEQSYRSLNEAVNQGIITNEKSKNMLTDRVETINSAKKALDQQKNSEEAVNQYMNAVEVLYKRKTELLNDPSSIGLDVSKLEADVKAAEDLLKELRDQKKITDDVFNSVIERGEKFATNYNNKKESKIAKDASEIEKQIKRMENTLEKGSFEKVINKFEKDFSAFGEISDEVQDKINELRASLDKMADRSLSDNDRISAANIFDSTRKSLNELYQAIERNNPFEKLSPKNTGLNYKSYIDLFEEARNKALELNKAIADKKPKDEIDALRNEVRKLGKELEDASKSDYAKSYKKSFNKFESDIENYINDVEFKKTYPNLVKNISDAYKSLNDQVHNGSISVDEYNDKIDKLSNNLYRTSRYMKGDSIFGNYNTSQAAQKAFSDYVNRLGAVTKDVTGSVDENDRAISRWNVTYREVDGTLKQVSATYDNVTKQMSLHTEIVGKELTGLAKVVDTFKSKFSELFIYWTARAFDMQSMIQYFRQAISIVREYDDALVEMRKVSDESIFALRDFQKASFDIANQVGTTGLQLQQSAADFMRLGESISDASKHAKEANILMNVSEFQSINDATDAFIAMTKAFSEIESSAVIDKLNLIGNNFAISTSGLAEALQKSASALKTAGKYHCPNIWKHI